MTATAMINCRKIDCGDRAFYRMALGLGGPVEIAENLAVLVDFRSPADALSDCERAARCVNLPMTGVGERYRNTRLPTAEDLLGFYRELLDTYRDGFAQVARLAAAEELIGFGCYFGKDRTGIAAFLLGLRFGLPIDRVVEDYCESGVQLRRSIDAMPDHWTKRGLTREAYADRLQCRPEIILGLHDYLRSRYGSVRDYLDC